jgi:uncharacterized protein (TIGR03437 family)
VETTLVSKLDASGNPLYVTAIGGASGVLSLDAAGNLYVSGGANPKAFATTPGASNASAPGGFVCKLRAVDGSILFCSLFVKAIESFTADPMGNVYFSTGGSTPSVAPTQGALALGTQSVQVTKLNPVGGIVYVAEFSGPQGHGSPTSVAADAQGNVWVAGHADADFPTTPNALLPSAPQSGAGFLAELNPSGTALLYSSFTDGTGRNAQIALDGDGNVYETDSTTAGGAILRKYSPGGAAILYKQDFANLALPGLPFAVDAAGNVTAVNATNSVNFLTYHPIDACAPINSTLDMRSWALIRVDASGKLIQSTFLSMPIRYPYLFNGVQRYPLIAANGYFLIVSYAMTNLTAGPFQLEIGQLGPAASPPIDLSCAGNAASLTLAALAPGEIVSLFGNGLGPAAPVSAQFANNRLPFNLAGSQVTFNGIPAPLLYASDSQINAIVPWGIQGASTANVCVVNQTNATNCITMNVANAAPGIFQLPSGYAAVVNQDGTINGPQNPAAIGSVVSLYVTGLGPLSPTPADGSIVGLPLPTPTNRVGVIFHTSVDAGQPLVGGDVLYAGAAPLEVAGLYQINVLIQLFPLPLTPPIPPARVEIAVELPNGSVVNKSIEGPPISIQGIDVVNR